MNASVARLVTSFVCLLVLFGCADSSTSAESADEAGADPAGRASELPAVGAPSNPGGHHLVAPGGGACLDVPIDIVKPVCAGDSWCWSHPLPQGNALKAVTGLVDDAGASEIWAVGVNGTILRLRGGVWEPIPSGTTSQLNAIWGIAPGDLWAAGESGVVLHYDGTTWSRVDVGDDVAFRAVWGTGGRDVWLAGDRGHVLHWNGTAWSRSPNPVPKDLNGLWGVPNDTRVNETRALWAVGNDGAQVKWDGARWSVVPSLHAFSSFAVSGTAPNNIWTGAEWGIATRYDGSDWSTSSTRSPFALRTIASTGASDVWAAGDFGGIHHYDGKAWVADRVGREGEVWRGSWACGPNSAWFVGDTGTVTQWTEESSYAVRTKGFLQGALHGGYIVDVLGISGTGPDDVWAAASNGIMHWDGSTWTLEATALAWGLPRAIWALAPNNVYVATYDPNVILPNPNGRLMHWDGSAWEEPDHPPFDIGYTAFGGSSASDIWLGVIDRDESATNPAGLLHFDGTAWRRVPNPMPPSEAYLARLWVPAPSEMWALDSAGMIFHRYRSTATQHDEFTVPDERRFMDLWSPPGAPMMDAWAVGEGGAIARWNGSTWTLQPSVTDRALYAVWGTSPTDVWAAGQGVILHYDGIRWNASYDVTGNRLGSPLSGGIWGSSAKDVWVIGERGTILRRRLP